MVEDAPIVFIVDDDDSVRKALARLIKSVDLNVETFASTNDFLKRESHNGPACPVLDVRMPGLSGLDLQDELVAAGRTLPIIFISAHGKIPLSVRAMKAGAVDFIEKPFEDQTLLDAIHQSLKKDRKDGTMWSNETALVRGRSKRRRRDEV
jgi:FixJ family two-component response regulator